MDDLTLDAGEVHFLAVRLRRLFKHFAYPLPEFAADDARLIRIAGSAIGAVLTNVECPECGGAGDFESALHYEKCNVCGGTGKAGVGVVDHQTFSHDSPEGDTTGHE